MPTKNNLQVNKTLVQISNSKYKRSLKKRLLVFYKVKKITDLVSLVERLLTLYSETPRTDKDLRGFWFKEITIYTKSQETNRDSWGENPYQIAI